MLGYVLAGFVASDRHVRYYEDGTGLSGIAPTRTHVGLLPKALLAAWAATFLPPEHAFGGRGAYNHAIA